jgi:UDP-N-acetylglucosamine 2-epimerase
MYDAILSFGEVAERCSTIVEDLHLEAKNYLLATIHRPSNTDQPENLRNIMAAFAEIDHVIVFPVHPRTRQKIAELESILKPESHRNLRMIQPVGYLDMLALEKQARMILTDSGGVQKEAYWFGVPCVTLRQETEWIETVAAGWNVLAGSDPARIVEAVQRPLPVQPGDFLSADGHAAQRIVGLMAEGKI